MCQSSRDTANTDEPYGATGATRPEARLKNRKCQKSVPPVYFHSVPTAVLLVHRFEVLVWSWYITRHWFLRCLALAVDVFATQIPVLVFNTRIRFAL